MEILKAMKIKPDEFSKGLILRGLCKHTASPWLFEVVHNQKDNKCYICTMDPRYAGASITGDIFTNYNICDYEEIKETTIRGVLNRIIWIINYYNKQAEIDRQLPYI